MLFSLNFEKNMGNFCKVFAAYKQVRDSPAFLYHAFVVYFNKFWYLFKDSVLIVPKTLVVLSNGICLTLCQ